MQKSSVFAVFLAVLMVQPAVAQVPSVVSDIAPVHALVAQVMGDLGTPDLILQPGASPHSYALRPSQARALQQADLVIWTGEPLTPWLEKPLGNLAQTALTIALLDLPETKRLAMRQNARFEGHDHDQEEAAQEDHEGHGDHDDHAEQTVIDPHAWLDPDNGKIWLGTIAAALADLDPEHASVYNANAARAAVDLDRLTDKIEAILAPFQGTEFVVFHDAYQYFETRFSVPALGALSLSDASDAGPARLAEVQALLRDRHITCVFAEPPVNTRRLNTVLQGTKARMVLVDPMGTTLAVGPALYGDMLVQMATDMAACAG